MHACIVGKHSLIISLLREKVTADFGSAFQLTHLPGGDEQLHDIFQFPLCCIFPAFKYYQSSLFDRQNMILGGPNREKTREKSIWATIL